MAFIATLSTLSIGLWDDLTACYGCSATVLNKQLRMFSSSKMADSFSTFCKCCLFRPNCEASPGFHGELPFKLETGYVSVGDSELFYYFIESQGDPEKDPLFLWLTGGPGCSSFGGLIFEIGPLEFDVDNYKVGLPELKYCPYAWTKSASFIFLDAPVGSGFSYARTPEGWHISDSESAEQSYQFLKKWFLEHPQYLLLQLYIGGDSYSGIPVPLITKKVIEGNEASVLPHLNLQGYLVGSPMTDLIIDRNSRIVFAHRLALISDELYEKLRKSCNEMYVDVDPSNTECVSALAYYEMNFVYEMAYLWANDPLVQDALHVRKGIVSEWVRCNRSLSYEKNVTSVVDVHRYLSTKGLQLLVETGDHDMSIPYVGTEKWIKSLNLTIADDWRPWYIDGQVAG
ncbi:hypothetical protein GH714_031129 [Hevea brasiliensis]|uniref:Uncharacterized protein n=1 Tax=Hevea brasiliensis TaxID=3981 RepID=A0A6A6N8L3_HEVBR|nr:hypothetical protein GH714_031129 [Hevea brasiliensis]